MLNSQNTYDNLAAYLYDKILRSPISCLKTLMALQTN